MNRPILHDDRAPLGSSKAAQRLLDSITAIIGIVNNGQAPFRQRLAGILQVILAHLRVEQGSIMVINRSKLVVEAASRKKLLGLAQPLKGDTLAAQVARSGRQEFIRDITRNPNFPNRQDQGTYRTKSVLSVPIKQDGKVLGVINVTDKCSGKKLLQEDSVYLLNFSSLVLPLIVQSNMLAEIKRQRRVLKKKNAELRKSQMLQGELSRMLVHDIKGPLSEAVANLDILSYSSAEGQKEFLAAAQLACDRTVRMASDLGSVAKIENGSMLLVKEMVDPARILDEALVGIHGLATSKMLDLQRHSAENLPLVQLDRGLIERVLQNLLINAIDHSPERTCISAGSRLHAEGSQVLFSVSDQGGGIAPEKQQIVFEKYARLHSRQSSLSGTGLGLYFCKLAVDRHGGSIGIDSSIGKGSTFYFSLPL